MTTADSPRTSARLALGAIVAVSAAALLLSGCGSAPARSAPPAAATGVTVSTGPDGWDRSAGTAPGGVVGGAPGSGDGGRAAPPEPAATTAAAGAPTAPGAPGGPGPAAVVPRPEGDGGTAAPAVDPGQSLAAIDRALADLDTQLTDADHDVATPEGDLR
ncbi:MAG: hypothetical protein QOD57_1499 [Actinomycetota bacterium]|nr:hypothetical protein [Actinomycetota bacterium]